ncbi:MAG: pyridoxal phosphate-dependent aminotransferase [Anaerofustis sp.]
MRKPLSDKLKQITPSMTLSITNKTKELRSEGYDTISFGAGEPDFPVNDVIKKAAIEGIEKNYSKYTEVTGMLALREAICEHLLRENGLRYQPNEIIVSSGAKHSLFTALQALLSDGDEVIIPAPYWVSYSEMAKIAGGKIVVVDTKKENNFILQPEELKKAITSRSKVIMLNNPSNPTGAVYTKDQLKAVAEICEKEGIYILSDEIYDQFVYEGHQFVSTASLSDAIKDITITVNGLSKTYAMPGWRVGYAAANQEIVKAMSTIQGHCVSHTSSISQYASITALKTDQAFVQDMLEEYKRRRIFMKSCFDSMQGISYSDPMGAFYFFVDVSDFYGKAYEGTLIEDSLSFCETFLKHYYVAIIPGIGFGNDHFVRFSYACSMDDIKRGLGRFSDFLSKIK